LLKSASLLLLLAAACATHIAHAARDLFGVRVEDTKTAVHAKLGAVGTLQREESKRQEVWELRDPRFQGAIVGYDAEWRVRFITAVAKEGGEPVRYADVLDVANATHRVTGTTHNYRWQPRGSELIVIAIGNDPERLTYLTLTKPNEPEAEDD
jgi:hypothetical protein